MGETASTWQGLLQHVVEANSDLVSSKRLKGHLDTFGEKKPSLKRVGLSDGRVELTEGFPEDDSGLVTVATVLGVLYWTMVDMHLEPAAAAERLRRPVREYIRKNLPAGTVMGLNRHLPALALEKPEETGESAEAATGPGAAVTAPSTGQGGEATWRPPPDGGEPGERRELWERSAGEDVPGAAAIGAGEPGAPGAAGGEASGTPAGSVPWLGEDLPRGCSLLVEGHGEPKETASLRFIAEGVAAGEAVLALLAYPPEEFRRRLGALGCDTASAEKAGRLKILDWATFRERHVEDLEDDGSVVRLPGELTSVNPAVNMALSDLPDSQASRAFVNILPRALATVAVETVFNFVQVTILKFRRRGMTGLFIMEEEKDPEKAAIRLSFDSWLEVEESPGGKFDVRLGGPVLRPKNKTVACSEGKWTVESESAIAPEGAAAPEPESLAGLRARAAEWRSQGHDVSALEKALQGGSEAARVAFERFDSDLVRLKTMRDDLRIMDLSGFESDAAAIQDMLGDIGRVEQAERAHAQLRQKLERKRVAAKGKAGPAAPEGMPPPPKATDASARAEAAGELLGGAEARRRENLRREQESVRGAQEQARVREEAERRARQPASGEDKRREYREDVARWRKEGYVVDQLEKDVELDLEQARKAVLLFRVQLQTLRKLGEDLASIDEPALEGRKAEIRAHLRDVAAIPNLEKGLERLRAEAARIREDDRSRREEDRRRRAALSEKLFWWSSHGLVVEGLELLMEGDLSEAERAFSSYEAKAKRLLPLKDALAAMDISGFRDEAARLEALLNDVENVERAEAAFADFRALAERQFLEALERKALTERMEPWRAKGFRVEPVLKALEGGADQARSELARFEERARAAEALSAQLSTLEARGLDGRVAHIREMLLDTARLEECRAEAAVLRAESERSRAEAAERAEHRRRIEGWKGSGLPTRQLEGLLDKDLPSLRKAVMAFQFDVDAYDDLQAQLEPLLRTRHADEASRLQRELKDLALLPELEPKVAALRAAAEAEATAAGQESGREFSNDIALMEKVRGWVAGGIRVRRLEGALGQDRNGWRAEMERLEKDIEDLSRETSALEVLDTKGHEAEIEHVRSLLNDPDNLPVVRAYRDALRVRIADRKKGADRKAAMATVARDWEQRGHRVERLMEHLDHDLEAASQQFVLNRARISAAEHLLRGLDALEIFGSEADAERLRRRLQEGADPAELAPELDRLWKAAGERWRERAARRKALSDRKQAIRERVMGWLEKGMSVRRLDRALEAPPDKAEKELARFEEDVRRLGALGERLTAMETPALGPEIEALRSRLDDVDAIPEIERGLQALGERAERSRLEEQARQEAEKARREEDKRRAALRRGLEERLARWSGLGINVESLRTSLATDLFMAEKRFEEFERAIERCAQLRKELSAILGKGPEGVAGAETVEKLLQDPLKLPQAEHAFEDFARRAEAALSAAEAERRAFEARVRELESRGEDVAALEQALSRGLPAARQAFSDFDRELVNRERMETWRGIRSRLLTTPAPAVQPVDGQDGTPGDGGGAPRPAPGGSEGPAEGESSPAGAVRKKVRKVKK